MTTPHRSPDAGTLRGLRHPVVVVGLGLVALQSLFRAWALYGSWFFTDDYRLLLDVPADGLTWEYVVSPFDSQFMPLGRLLAWVVAEQGQLNWPAAATFVLAFQLLASLACLWMLVTLFGPRWGALGLLAVYLTSSVTMPALMWWAAAVNQIPLQICFFVAVGAWVKHLRGGGSASLLGTIAAVGLGLLFYVKALLVFPVLAVIALSYFASGSLKERTGQVVGRYWPALGVGGLIAISYVLFYGTQVPQPFVDSEDTGIGEVADAMLGTSVPTASLGGPWTWWRTSPPIVLADPPNWSVHLSWIVISLVIAYSVLRRRHVLPAWGLLAGYAVALYALLATSRGQLFGRLAGLELRYLTDLVLVLVLVLGLVFLPLQGAVQSSSPRTTPLLTVKAPGALVIAAVGVICLGGLVSSIRYIGFWHDDNAGKPYVQNLAASLERQDEPPDLVEQTLPDDVMPAYTQPNNEASTFIRVLGEEARFPRASSRLKMIAPDGQVRAVGISTGYLSRRGPREACGWAVGERGRSIPLDGTTFPWGWWARIGYLASDQSPVTVTAGASTVTTVVEPGLNSLYVRLDGTFDALQLSGLSDGVKMCVDTIEVGNPVPIEEPS